MDYRRGPVEKTVRLGVPVLLPQDIPTAIFCATLTMVLLGSKSIVITEFFALGDVPFGNNPDGAFGDQDFTVGLTGMVDIAGFVFQGFAVDIVAMIACNNVLIALIKAFGGFFLGNSLPNVLNNPRAFVDILSGEQSFARNARHTNPDAHFHGILLKEEGKSPHAALCIR
jgi:hypothetical protein